MITIKFIPDIFTAENRHEFMVPYSKDKELYLSIFTDEKIYRESGIIEKGFTPQDLIESCDIWYQGKVISPEDYSNTKVGDCSEIVFFMRPGKGGVWQLLVGAVMIAVGWWNPLGWKWAGYLIATGIVMMLSGVSTMVFTPESPNFEVPARNLNYGWEGAKTEYSTVGTMVPVCYGRVVTGGKCISQRIRVNEENDQILDLLLLLGEGPIRGIRKKNDSGAFSKMEATTIAFADNDPDPDTITDSANGFLTAGFVAGEKIKVSGSGKNNGRYTIDSVTAGTITLIAADKLKNETAGKSVTIQSLPWIKLDGNFISDVPGTSWNYRLGTLDQTIVEGFKYESSNYPDSQKMTTGWYTIPDAGGGGDFERAEFNFVWPYGLHYTYNDQLRPWTTKIRIEYKKEPAGSWTLGKEKQWFEFKMGPFYKMLRFKLPEKASYSFRIKRTDWPLQEDLPGYADRVDLQSYNRITYSDLTYPGCALISVHAVATDRISSAQPNVEIKLDGRILKYYDGEVWQDETWDTGGGDGGDVGRNPAWQNHDIIYNGVYGLGPYFDDSLKASLKFKDLADYANGLVDDGQGGTEKRFMSDVIIDGIIDPWDMIKELLRSCHTFPVIAGAQIWPVVEKERSPVMSFGMDNVATDEKGNTLFTETWRTLEDTPNIVEVQYFDAKKNYVREVVHFPDDDSLIPQGEKIRKLTCVFHNVSRRSQALRLAKYHWLLAQHIKRFNQFPTNEEALALQPGDVFYFSHDIPQFDYSGKIFRVRSEDNIIELDNSWAAVDTGQHTYKLLIRDLTDDTIDVKDVTAITTENKRHLVAFSGSYSFNPEPGDPYILIEDTTVPIKYVCMELGRDENMRRTISAQEYNPDIFDYEVDKVEDVDYSDLPNPNAPPDPPTDLTLTEMGTQFGFYVSAVVPIDSLNYDHCRIFLTTDQNWWDEIARTRLVDNFPVTSVLPGVTYYVKVVSYNRVGNPCENPPTETITIQGIRYPPKVRGLEIHGRGNSDEFVGKHCKIQWKLATLLLGLGFENLGEEGTGLGESLGHYIKDTKVSIFVGNVEKRTEFVSAPGNTYIYSLEKNIEDNIDAQRSFEFRLWYRDNYNRLSPEYASLKVTNTAPSMAGKTPTVSDIPYGVKVDWTGIAPYHHDVDKYHVYCDENNPPQTIRARVSAYETIANIVNLDPDTTYFIRVIPGDPYGMGTASNIVQKSIPRPSVVVPVGPSDPTQLGEIKVIESLLEFDDCDDYTKWTSEIGGIVLANDGEALKEGSGSLKIAIDKYTVVTENLWYTIPNPPYPPQIPGTMTIGTLYTKYVTQGFKVDAACDLKMEGIIVWKAHGFLPDLKVMIYTDDGNGNPNTKLGEADFIGVNEIENWRWAEFGSPISLSPSTQYHKIYCRIDEGHGDVCYECRVGTDRYGDPQYDYVQYGDSLSNLIADTDKDLIFRSFKDEATINNHFKITSLGSKDISGYPSFEYWIKSNLTKANWLQASMGESALGEQTNNPSIAENWKSIAWDISGIAAGDRDAIAFFGFKVLDPDQGMIQDGGPGDGKIWLWVDYIRATRDKAVKVKFADEVARLYRQIPIGFRDGCRPKYKSASDIYIQKGQIEIAGYGAVLDSDLTVTWADLDTGAEAVDTWYYLYLVKPNIDGETPTAKISATAPSIGFRDKYHPNHSTWRCVGSFYNDAGGIIQEAYYHNDGWTHWDAYKQNLFNGNATTRTAVTMLISAIAKRISVEAHVAGNTAANRYAQVYSTSSGGSFQMELITRGDASFRIRTREHGSVPIVVFQTLYYICENATVDLNLYTHGYWEDL